MKYYESNYKRNQENPGLYNKLKYDIINLLIIITIIKILYTNI